MDLKNTNGAITKIVPGSADAKLLIRRQMITLVYVFVISLISSTRKFYKVQKGEKFAIERRKQQADITKEMLDGSAEEITLKP